ncbi:MAG: acetyl-CoA C-acyltransferase [Spirochaetae bacterium HGW-Spirochaetae-5]|nr:MAG: acetyl-CoA C-acyltransferase [Spirochaetae bacterium HGW-Spirochaetae-5]
MREAYIVEAVRTPGCKRAKGLLAQTRPEDLLKTALHGVMERSGVSKDAVEDVMIGCSFPEAEQGINIGRIATLMAGFPITACGATVNRFCSSGLESIAISAMKVMSGYHEVTIGGGVESMSIVPMGGNLPRPHPEWAKQDYTVYMSMGITAENVARRYDVKREDQDHFAVHSHLKAADAQAKGLFTEIVPVDAYKFVAQPDGSYKKESYKVDYDDGVQNPPDAAKMAKLRGAFSGAIPGVANSGSVTAANSSQTTDGAAATLIMSKEAMQKYGVKPKVKLLGYTVAGCKPDEMGIGPAVAIPKLLKQLGMTMEQVMKDGIIELNEAFASQGIYCARQLGFGDPKYFEFGSKDLFINPTGGAIALGHPLGCSGAKIFATLVNNMQRMGKKYGMESMCIGGGMGAAALFELVE